MTSSRSLRMQLDGDTPPEALPPALKALWWDARGAWEKAHDLIAADTGRDAAWVHAYLHRKEGDASNAAYWYRRAGRQQALGPLPDEWAEIVEALLKKQL